MDFNIFMSKFKQIWEHSRTQILHYNIIHKPIFKYRKSSSGFTHVYIMLDREVNCKLANILQFLCGDHAYRVMLNQRRINVNIKNWNKFFYRKKRIDKKKAK